MRVTRRTLFVLCMSLLLLPGIAAAADSTPSGMYSTDNGFNPKMLDTSVPQAERIKLFAQVIQLAKQGMVRAQDLAGTMYWQGAKIQGSPIQANSQQAHILLANAAVHGDVLDMAKLAEMELAAGHPQKAMVWTQLYAHYIDPMKSAREQHDGRYNYASDLMERITKAGGKIDDKLSKEVNSMVSRFDRSIRAGITTFRQQRRSGNLHLVKMPAGSTPHDLRTKSGVAEYMVAFDPKGTPANVWLIASYPTADFGKQLRPQIDHARANPVGSNDGMRYMLVPVTNYSVKAHVLRAHH